MAQVVEQLQVVHIQLSRIAGIIHVRLGGLGGEGTQQGSQFLENVRGRFHQLGPILDECMTTPG